MQPIPDLETLKTGALMLIDKSYKWTSFDALFKIKKGLKVKKLAIAAPSIRWPQDC
jgi:tRNA U55 pseudouridine synthase TruB